ncbi:MAG: histidine--tRNA ligase [Candidatus Omnitrophica bacterium]|nr:histidine--tRNA ligase [Candidatus Omnitrophota bacterium]
MLKKVLGTRDILPEEIDLWQEIENSSRFVFSLYGYKEIRTPIIEDISLFNRSLGDSTEIVQKQMFEIKREKEIYVLRPEATASIVRAYLENNLDKKDDFLKLYYIGPMFRAERPQKGRLRQFHHIGCEAIGSLNPYLDAEIISLAKRLLDTFNIKGYEIKINSLGCSDDKRKLAEILKKDLEDKLSLLCVDCQDRYQRNVFRILDCKNESCRKVVVALNLSDKYLCKDCLTHFESVKIHLERLKVKYKIAPYLVRGLDYYTRTVFEITHKDLGSQDAIGAGGRYDNLIKQLGGKDTPAMGFAFGAERLILVKKPEARSQRLERKLTYIITLGKKAETEGFILLDRLRQAEIAADMDYRERSIKGQMRRADALMSRFTVIIGEDELEKGMVGLKDMVSGEQREVKTQDLIGYLKKKS